MIRTIFLFLLTIPLFTQTLPGQQARQIQFREEIFDFGNVNEEKGPVVHEFIFTNTGNRPLKILNVQPSCGCTTPSWTKETVPPGKTGSIQASFDPKGRPGFFNKSLTVTTDLEPSAVILQIKGQVSAGEDDKDMTGFDVMSGNLKLRVSAFNMGKIFLKDEYVVREFPVVNPGNNAIQVTDIVSPKYIKAEVVPSTLGPGSKGIVRVSYNGKLRNQYGFQSDNITITTNDEVSPVKSFSVYATIEDFFPALSPEELNRAPHLKLSSYSLDFGNVIAGSEVVREVRFINSGKKPLEIRAVQANCTCVKASSTKAVVNPGEAGAIRITFDPQDRKGTHQKAVTIYSNDPRSPVQRVTLSAYVVGNQ